MKRWTGALLSVAIVAGVFASPLGAQAQDPKLVAMGRRLFGASGKDCTQCHMAEGKGNKKLRMDGPAAKVAKLTPDEIRQWITSPEEMTAKLPQKPENPMKKKVLTEAETDALVAFMMSLRTKK